MPIGIRCPKCGRKLNVPDKYAGKRAKCPKCQGIIEIPASGGQAAAPRSAPKTPGREKKSAETKAVAKAPGAKPEGGWYLKADDGEQYGPVEKKELDAWVAEGRIDASCQLLREGGQQWKWAEDVYPQLAQPAAASEPAPAGQPVMPPLPLPSQPAPQIGPVVVQKETESMAARTGRPHAAAQTPDMRRTLADCLRPWLIFTAIMLALGGAVGSCVFFLAVVWKNLQVFAYHPVTRWTWPMIIIFLRNVVILGAMVTYVVAGWFLFVFQQKLNVFLRREASPELGHAMRRELGRTMRAYRIFWLLIYAATFAPVGALLINVLLGLLWMWAS